jgi:uncharacterized protein
LAFQPLNPSPLWASNAIPLPSSAQPAERYAHPPTGRYHPGVMSSRSPSSATANARVFLTAEWRDLVMLNYAVDPVLLHPHVPRGTELDAFDGQTLVSLIGFRFRHTRIFGTVRVPFHSDFDEVNLRFYVHRLDSSGETRRGVVFIREIVPKRAVALIARLAYNENYSCYPMRHRVGPSGQGLRAEYAWRHAGKWMRLRAQADGEPAHPAEGSLEQFVSEHYWGYSRQRDGGTLEYQVTHPQWRVWRSANAALEGDGVRMYGAEFGHALARRPDSAFLADGSEVSVLAGKRIA